MGTLTQDENYFIDWMRFCVALISFLCSSCTLFLIYHMKVRNGYFLLIASMTAFQILYDINFMQGVLPSYANCVAWHVLDYLGGLSFSIWSNILSFIVLYIVVKIRSLNILGNYAYFFTLAVLPPFVLAMMTIPALEYPADDDSLSSYWCVFDGTEYAYAVQGVYYWGRICTILFNFCIFIYVSFRVQQMTRALNVDDKSILVVTPNPINQPGITEQRDPARANSSTAISQSAAIVALVSRMKYYPLAQAIARSGSAWDQFDDYHYSCFASAFMSALCGPSSGILNFIIFLVMQPKAFQTLRSFFCTEREEREGSFVSRQSSFALSVSHSVIGSFLQRNNTYMSTFEYDEDALESAINEQAMLSTASPKFTTRNAIPTDL